MRNIQWPLDKSRGIREREQKKAIEKIPFYPMSLTHNIIILSISLTFHNARLLDLHLL
jgi:hypothetical protein